MSRKFRAAPKAKPRGRPSAQERRALETRRRRRRALWRSAVLWVPLTFVGCDLAITPGLARTGLEEYQAGEYAEAVDTYEPMDGFNLVERWRAPFNYGTALTQEGLHWDALEAFDRSLELAPEEHYCLVQRNRAIAIEAGGDGEMERSHEYAAWAEEARALEEAGEEPPEDAPWGDQTADELAERAAQWAEWAAVSYGWARDARTDPACPPPEDPQEQEQEQAALDRLEDKQEEADTAAGQAPEPEPQPETEEERQAALDERNAEAAAQAEAERQERAARDAEGSEETDSDGDGTGGGSPRNW